LARILITASYSFECRGSYEYLRSVFGKMIDSDPQRRRLNLTLLYLNWNCVATGEAMAALEIIIYCLVFRADQVFHLLMNQLVKGFISVVIITVINLFWRPQLPHPLSLSGALISNPSRIATENNSNFRLT
jgi:hypothetical protein